MKTNLDNSGDTRNPKKLFIVLSEFATITFPVRIRYFRTTGAASAKTPSTLLRPNQEEVRTD